MREAPAEGSGPSSAKAVAASDRTKAMRVRTAAPALPGTLAAASTAPSRSPQAASRSASSSSILDRSTGEALGSTTRATPISDKAALRCPPAKRISAWSRWARNSNPGRRPSATVRAIWANWAALSNSRRSMATRACARQ